jgi:hypothetical protein
MIGKKDASERLYRSLSISLLLTLVVFRSFVADQARTARSCSAARRFAIQGTGDENVRKLISSVSVVRSASRKEEDRGKALAAVDPTKPQEVAQYLKEHGSRFGDDDFRGTDTWHDAIDRVAEGGPTLDE